MHHNIRFRAIPVECTHTYTHTHTHTYEHRQKRTDLIYCFTSFTLVEEDRYSARTLLCTFSRMSRKNIHFLLPLTFWQFPSTAPAKGYRIHTTSPRKLAKRARQTWMRAQLHNYRDACCMMIITCLWGMYSVSRRPRESVCVCVCVCARVCVCVCVFVCVCVMLMSNRTKQTVTTSNVGWLQLLSRLSLYPLSLSLSTPCLSLFISLPPVSLSLSLPPVSLSVYRLSLSFFWLFFFFKMEYNLLH